MRRRVYLISLVGFVALAMPKAAFGVAWPSVSDALGVPIGDLGTVIAIYIGGYFVTSLFNGAVTRRFGAGPTLVLASWITVVALAGYAVTPTFGILLISAFVLGLAGGLIDAAVNTHVTLRHGARAMGMLHAAFGVGGTLGPLMMTILLGFDRSWRWGFVILAVVQVGVAVAFTANSSGWTTSEPAADGDRRRGWVPRSPVAILTLVAFAAYGGVEVGVGQWAYTLLTEGRGVATGPAGLAVTGFWAGLTLSRFGLGIFGDRFDASRTVSVAGVASLFAVTMLWWAPAPWVGVGAIVVTGFALGPVFPMHTLLTPVRVGVGATAAMVGYQLAAATVGSAAIPGLIGALTANHGLEVAGPVLTATAAVLVVVTGILSRRAPEGDANPTFPPVPRGSVT